MLNEKWWELTKSILEKVAERQHGLKPGQVNFEKGVEKVRREFEDSKGHLLPYFDEDGRKTEKVDRSAEPITVEGTRQALNRGRDWLMTKVRREPSRYYRSVKVIDGGEGLSWFLSDVLQRFTPSEIEKNTIKHATVFDGLYLLADPARPSKVVQEGYKISKYMMSLIDFIYDQEIQKMFIIGKYSEEDRELIKELTGQMVSRVLEEVRNSEETVVLSINPVDILFNSEHTNGWRSCHNIVNGEFATAGLSMLLDSTSTIAYSFKEERMIELLEDPSITLPSKIWRQMVSFNLEQQAAVFGREYPGTSDMPSKYARRLAAQVLTAYHNVEYKWKVKYLNIIGSKSSAEEEEGDGGAGRDTDGSWLYGGDPFASRIRLATGETNPMIRIGVKELICPYCLRYRDPSSDSGEEIGSRGSIVCGNCARAFKTLRKKDRVTEPAQAIAGDEVFCVACDEVISVHHGTTRVDEDFYCTHCFGDNFIICDQCDELVPLDEGYRTVRGEEVCESCCDEHYAECEECGNIEHEEDSFVAYNADGERNVCESCRDRHYRECMCCEDTMHEDMVIMYHDDAYCEECFSEHFFECADCGDTYHDDDAQRSPGGDEWYCTACFDESFTDCEHCGEVFHRGDLEEHPVGQVCVVCCEELDDQAFIDGEAS